MNKNFLPIIILIIGLFLIFNVYEKKEEGIIDTIKLDIKGAVLNPGVYELDRGSRLEDLIIVAGGLRFDASTKYLNLSKTLEDETVVVIYTINEVENGAYDLNLEFCNCPEISNDTCIKEEENNKEKININTATLEELMTLSGIGKSKANAIIEHRTNNGNFLKIEDIMYVKGIGEGMFEKIKTFITV